MAPAAPIGVIILAGGRSTRMGADKAQVRVGGVRLIDALLSNLPASWPRVVVSPLDLGLVGVPTVSEEPPFGGPVAGIAAGLAHLDRCDAASPPERVAVLAVDAPRSAGVLPQLAAALDADPNAQVGVVRSADGRIQPLCALWRRDALRAALAGIEPRDAPAMALLRAAPVVVEVPGDGAERDYDTPGQLAELGPVEL